MLYELLSGAAPFDKERLKLASFDELRRIIREEDPPAPSNRVSLLGANLPALMTHHMDARRLSKLLKGDLDWVVTKAIDKDRRRRYDSAGDLANDIRRYLANEPVLARPRSAGYRLQKFAQRNRFVLFVTTVVISVVLLAIVNLVLSNAMIRREQERTQEEKARAEKALQLAEDRAEEIRAGLERLVAANAQLERGYWYAEHRRWDDAEKAYTRAVQLRPEDTNALVVRSELRGILGLWTHAATDYAREMELHESELTWRWFRHALLRLHVGDEAGYRHACRRMQELFHGTIAHEMASEVVRTCLLVPNPEVDISRMLEIQGQVVASEPGSWLRQYLMGVAHYRAGEYSQAVECLQTSLTASNEAVRGLSYPVLAMSYFKLGQPVEAQRSLNAAAECLESWTQYRCNIEGGNWVIHRGATIRWPIAWWDWVEFHIYYREARLLIGGMLPSVDPRWHVLTARSLAALRWRDEAEREFATALRLSPNDEQILLESYCNRGDRAIDLKQLDDAIDSYRRAVELQPQNVALWRFLSVAQLAAQDHAGYRQLCAAMVHHFKGTQDRFAACNVLQVCSLLPNAINDLSLLEPLLSIAKSDWHFGTWTRGGALYRMGRTQESLTVLESGAHVYRPSSYEWAFRSMASQRLGNLPEARRCLRESQLWLKQASERSGDDLSGTQPSWGAWDERVQFPLLIREAEELLRGDGASP
jgi:tetratricopeptide (TPR) repeat protein